MNTNELINSNKTVVKKAPIERKCFEVLKNYDLHLNNEDLCEMLKAKTSSDWKFEVCLDRNFGAGPNKHSMPLCYDLVFITKDKNKLKEYLLLHSYYTFAGDTTDPKIYSALVKANEHEKDKLKNANWVELFLNAENRKGTLYCGSWFKEPLPSIIQETLTEFLLELANHIEKPADENEAE